MVLRHREDLLVFTRSLFALPILLILVVFGLPPGRYGLLGGLCIWFLLNDMNFLLHQHVHCPWTQLPVLNRLVDTFLSLVTGMSAYNWRLTHLLRHHRGDDSWGRGYRWEVSEASMLGALSFCLRGIPIVFLAPVGHSFVRGIVRRQSGEFSFRVAFIEQMGVAMFIATVMYMSPGFYCTYYFSVFFFSRLTDYQNHVGCDENSPYGFANNVLNERYNWVRDNFGYHTAHHYHPDAHWTELPKLHELIASEIPADRISQRSWTGLLTPPLMAYWVRQGIRAAFSRQHAQKDAPGNDGNVT